MQDGTRCKSSRAGRQSPNPPAVTQEVGRRFTRAVDGQRNCETLFSLSNVLDVLLRTVEVSLRELSYLSVTTPDVACDPFGDIPFAGARGGTTGQGSERKAAQPEKKGRQANHTLGGANADSGTGSGVFFFWRRLWSINRQKHAAAYCLFRTHDVGRKYMGHCRIHGSRCKTDLSWRRCCTARRHL